MIVNIVKNQLPLLGWIVEQVPFTEEEVDQLIEEGSKEIPLTTPQDSVEELEQTDTISVLPIPQISEKILTEGLIRKLEASLEPERPAGYGVKAEGPSEEMKRIAEQEKAVRRRQFEKSKGRHTPIQQPKVDLVPIQARLKALGPKYEEAYATLLAGNSLKPALMKKVVFQLVTNAATEARIFRKGSHEKIHLGSRVVTLANPHGGREHAAHEQLDILDSLVT